MEKVNIQKVLDELKEFRDKRDWKQFHTLKNLICGLNVEAGELLEHVIWEDLKEPTDKQKKEVEKELADVFNYVLLIADKLDVNLEKISMQKIKENDIKYPVEKSKGNSKKYNEL